MGNSSTRFVKIFLQFFCGFSARRETNILPLLLFPTNQHHWPTGYFVSDKSSSIRIAHSQDSILALFRNSLRPAVAASVAGAAEWRVEQVRTQLADTVGASPLNLSKLAAYCRSHNDKRMMPKRSQKEAL